MHWSTAVVECSIWWEPLQSYCVSMFIRRGGSPTRQEFTLTHWMQQWELCLGGKNLCCKFGFVKLQSLDVVWADAEAKCVVFVPYPYN